MRFTNALYALAFATCAVASPIQDARAAGGEDIEKLSNTEINGQAGQTIQILTPEAATGAIVTEEIKVTINDPELTSTNKLEERINTQSANNVGYGKAIAAVVQAAYDQAKQIKDWDKARETFTKGMVGLMASKNPDWNRAKAAICYNKGYRIRDPSNYYGLRSISFSSGLLKTDYDCFYLGNNNAFWYSEGGFQNLAMNYPTDYCTWDRGVALTCM